MNRNFLISLIKSIIILAVLTLMAARAGPAAAVFMEKDLRDAEERMMIKDFQGALNIYNYVLEEDPENVEALNGRGRALSWMGRYEAARSAYREALLFQPGNLDAITGTADTYAWESDYGEAIRMMEREHGRRPGDKEVLIRLARYNLKMGRRDEALYYAQKILDVSPRDRDAREIRDTIYTRYRFEAFGGYSYLNINNSSDGHNGYGGLRFNPGADYTLFGRLDFLDRFDETEGKFTGGGTYRIGEKLQMSGEVGFAPGAEIFPEAAGMVELASPALTSWVMSGNLNYAHYHTAKLYGFSIAGEYYPYGYISILTRLTLSRIEFDGGGESTDGALLLKTTWFIGTFNNIFAYFAYGNEAFKPNTIDRVGDIHAKILGFGATVFFSRDWGLTPSFEYLDRDENTRYIQVGMGILRRW